MINTDKALGAAALILGALGCAGPQRNPDRMNLANSDAVVAAPEIKPDKIDLPPKPDHQHSSEIDLSLLSLDIPEGTLTIPPNLSASRLSSNPQIEIGQGFKVTIHPAGIVEGLFLLGTGSVPKK